MGLPSDGDVRDGTSLLDEKPSRGLVRWKAIPPEKVFQREKARAKRRYRSVRERVNDIFRRKAPHLSVPVIPMPPNFDFYSEEENAVVRAVLERNLELVNEVILTERSLKEKVDSLEEMVETWPNDMSEVCHHCLKVRTCDRVPQFAANKHEKIWVCQPCQFERHRIAFAGGWFHETDSEYESTLTKSLLLQVSKVLHIGSYEGFEEVLGTMKPVGKIQVRLLFDESHNLLFVSVINCKDLSFSLDAPQRNSWMAVQVHVLASAPTGANRHTAPSRTEVSTHPTFEQLFVWTDFTAAELEESVLQLSVWLTSPRCLIGKTEIPMRIVAVNDQAFWLQLFPFPEKEAHYEEKEEAVLGRLNPSRPGNFSKSIRKLLKNRSVPGSDSELSSYDDDDEDDEAIEVVRDDIKDLNTPEEDDLSKYLSASWEVIPPVEEPAEPPPPRLRIHSGRRAAVVERQQMNKLDPNDLKMSLKFVLKRANREIEKERKVAASQFYPTEDISKSRSLPRPSKQQNSRSLPRNLSLGLLPTETSPTVSLLDLSKNFDREVSPLENKRDYFAEEPITPETERKAVLSVIADQLPIVSSASVQRNCVSVMEMRSLERHYGATVQSPDSGSHSDADGGGTAHSSLTRKEGDHRRPTVAQLIFPTISLPRETTCVLNSSQQPPASFNGEKAPGHSLAAAISNGEVHMILTLKGNNFDCHITDCRKLVNYEQKKSVFVSAAIFWDNKKEVSMVSSGKKVKKDAAKLDCHLRSKTGVEGRVLEVLLKQKRHIIHVDMFTIGATVIHLDEIALPQQRLITGWYSLHPRHHGALRSASLQSPGDSLTLPDLSARRKTQ